MLERESSLLTEKVGRMQAEMEIYKQRCAAMDRENRTLSERCATMDRQWRDAMEHQLSKSAYHNLFRNEYKDTAATGTGTGFLNGGLFGNEVSASGVLLEDGMNDIQTSATRALVSSTPNYNNTANNNNNLVITEPRLNELKSEAAYAKE